MTEQDRHVRYRRTIILFHEVLTISPLLIAEQIYTDIWLLGLTGKEMQTDYAVLYKFCA